MVSNRAADRFAGNVADQVVPERHVSLGHAGPAHQVSRAPAGNHDKGNQARRLSWMLCGQSRRDVLDTWSLEKARCQAKDVRIRVLAES